MQKKQLSCISFICIFMLFLGGCMSGLPLFDNKYYVINNNKLISRAEGQNILYYSDGKWEKRFWTGVNLGATTPGYHPGELSPTYEDYLRWFKDMEELGINVVRVYTILPPHFYQALVDHNKTSEKKLWFIQGIWSPEEELISQQNAYLPEITNKFHREICLAIRAVYGNGEIAASPGKASGIYSVNCAPYLLAWILGTEWDPYMVEQTNKINFKTPRFQGLYFKTTAEAHPFESWLANCLETLAEEEIKTGWQHPISFVNWVTTDPLSHPNEPLPQEDLVSVDPSNILSTKKWHAGYFASYHVYPYYPDSLLYQEDYQQYLNPAGKNDPYEAYLSELQKHHNNIPLIIAEFGVPSSRGLAHKGSLDRDQGMHSEYEQGKMNVEMLQAIKNAGGSGAILFAWQDEWFKHTWNTMNLELPADRRPMWLNPLTNEENFGLLAVEPGNWTKIYLDGKVDDWDEIEKSEKNIAFDDEMELTVTSDEAYLYLSVKKHGNWNWNKESLLLGFDNQPGGNKFIINMPFQFKHGIEFLFSINDIEDASLKVASAYDQHIYLYGKTLKMIPWNKDWQKENTGIFLPWKLCLSRELYLPASQKTIPFAEVDIGLLNHGNSNPDSPEYNSLADYYIENNVLEIRIPWMMLGFTDPSSHQVWAYPYRTNLSYFTSLTSNGLNIEAVITDKNNNIQKSSLTLSYDWENWDIPTYHERKKESYSLLKSYITSLEQHS